MALETPRPLRGQCVKAVVKKKDRFERGGPMREYGPGPLRGQCVKAAVKKKGRFERAGQIRGIRPWRHHGH